MTQPTVPDDPDSWDEPRVYICGDCGGEWPSPPLREPEVGCPEPGCDGDLLILDS